jgi:hypothetical protein
VVVCHEVAGATTFTGWAGTGELFAFNFIHGIDAFLFFLLLGAFPFSAFFAGAAASAAGALGAGAIIRSPLL